MKKSSVQKLSAWTGLIMVILFLIGTFKWRLSWWMFIDVFFWFMAAFACLVALYFSKANPAVAQKLNNISWVCVMLAIIAFGVEWALLY